MSLKPTFDTIGDEPIEARIVAWVLGDASAFEATELERLCDERPELLVFRRRMLALHGLLIEAEAGEADHSAKLPPAKRKALDELFGVENPEIFLASERESRTHRGWRGRMLAIAACLALMVVLGGLAAPRLFRMSKMVPLAANERTFTNPSAAVESEVTIRELKKAIRAQEDTVEERRKLLANITRSKGIVYHGAGMEDDKGAKSTLDTFNQLETEKLQLEGMIQSLLKYDKDQLMTYASGLQLPDNAVQTLYPKYLEQKSKLESLKKQGVGDRHPELQVQQQVTESMKKQIDEGVVQLRDTLQAKLDLADARYKRALTSKNEKRNDAVKHGLDTVSYADVKRDLEGDEQLLQQMKLKLLGEEIASKMPDQCLALNDAAKPASSMALRSGSESLVPLKTNYPPELIEGTPKAILSELKSIPYEAPVPQGLAMESGRKHDKEIPQAPQAKATSDLAANPAKGSRALDKLRTDAPAASKPAASPPSAPLLAKNRAPETAAVHDLEGRHRAGVIAIELADSSTPRADGDVDGPSNKPAEQTDPFGEMTPLTSLNGGTVGGLGGQGNGRGFGQGSSSGVAHATAAAKPAAASAPVLSRTEVLPTLRGMIRDTAEGNYNLGKYDAAKKEYENVLRTDPSNRAARRGLEVIASAKSAYYRAAYDQTRAELLMDVDKAWELELPKESSPRTEPPSTTDLFKAFNKQADMAAPAQPGAMTPADTKEKDEKLPEPPGAAEPEGEKAKPEEPPALDLTAEGTAAAAPYSTFSLSISDASFKMARAALARGERPEPASIKLEQFYNAVDYGDPAAGGSEPVAAWVEQAAHPVIPGRNLVRVALRTGAAGRSASQPLRLTLLVDQSGSMAREDRRLAMQNALTQLGGLLTKNDSVTVIGFSRRPRLLADALPGDQASRLNEVVNQAASEGGTNLEEAMKLGEQMALQHQTAGAQNRIVLFTDGAANLGDANPLHLAERVKALRQKGLAFDVAGIGTNELNDRLLAELARHGNGRYSVAGAETDPDGGFARQLAGAFRPAAENVKVQVRFNPQRVGKYRLLGFEEHRLKTEDFRNDAVDAAELAAEEAGVALYQVEPLADGTGELGEVSVRFRDTASGRMVERSWTIPYEATAPAFDQSAPSMQLAGLALLAAEKLRGGPLADAIDFKLLAAPRATVKQYYSNSRRVAEMLEVVGKL
ncbi:MAG: von Willebrand factor type A domain-containing protein [Verrucomicrobiota bacterium]